MLKQGVDYNALYSNLYNKRYRLKDVEHRLEKVAFDVVRFKDSDESARLWQVQSCDDGDYIVALYDDDENVKQSSWQVAINDDLKKVSFAYKKEHIITLASDKLGIDKNELSSLPRYLPKSLETNKKLVTALLNNLSSEAKKEILTKYPELG